MSGTNINVQGQKFLKVNGVTSTYVSAPTRQTMPTTRNSQSGPVQNIIMTPHKVPVGGGGGGGGSTPYSLKSHSPQKGYNSHNSGSMAGSSVMGNVAASSSSSSPSKRRKVLKENKGLRHFSMKVCEKVKEKQTTTYNEVADELVADEMARAEASHDHSGTYDQKNIRRRVYDALNVLMAMNIISKEKKEIHWLGLPTNTPAQCANLDKEIENKRKAVAAKEKELKEMILLQVSWKNLVNRNRDAEMQGYIPTPNSHIQLPFIVVNTHRETHINCSLSQDKTEYFFKFDDKFEIHDHVKVMQRMGLMMGLDTGTSTEDEIATLKRLVPPQFQKLVETYGRGESLMEEEEEDGVEHQLEAADVHMKEEEYSEIEEEVEEESYVDDY